MLSTRESPLFTAHHSTLAGIYILFFFSGCVLRSCSNIDGLLHNCYSHPTFSVSLSPPPPHTHAHLPFPPLPPSLPHCSSNGYKMCIRAYLNGDGIGYKTHFSVFFVLMRGEFDPLLKWPFEYKVRPCAHTCTNARTTMYMYSTRQKNFP